MHLRRRLLLPHQCVGETTSSRSAVVVFVEDVPRLQGRGWGGCHKTKTELCRGIGGGVEAGIGRRTSGGQGWNRRCFPFGCLPRHDGRRPCRVVGIVTDREHRFFASIRRDERWVGGKWSTCYWGVACGEIKGTIAVGSGARSIWMLGSQTKWRLGTLRYRNGGKLCFFVVIFCFADGFLSAIFLPVLVLEIQHTS